MRISFVRPNMSATRSTDAMQPLVFAVLAGLTPPKHEIILHDERVEDVPLDEPTDLVAITVETYTARRAYVLAQCFRDRGVRVVMGGVHPTLAPEEALEHADAVVIGDAEGVWERVLADAERGRLQSVYRQQQMPSLAGVRYDRSIFARKRYVRYPLIQFQRGCRFNCDFCSIRAFYGSDLRHRPVEEVVAEIESLGSKGLFIVDDNVFSQPEPALALFEALAELDVHWSAQITIDIAADDRYLDLLQRSGCGAVLIGFESLDEASLRQMKKQWNLRHGDYATVVQKIHDRGIMVYGTFVFGYDHDTVDAFDVSLDFALRSGFFLANFNPLTPTPGTPLYDRLRRQGRLIRDPWWLNPGYRYGSAHFHPARMSADQLTEGCYRARTGFYKYSSIVRRLAGPGPIREGMLNLGLFLSANLISRREIHRKQGRLLGPTPGRDGGNKSLEASA